MELTYEEREGLGTFRVGHKFGVDVSAGETLEIYKKNFPAFVIHATTDAECDITLDATSPLGADFDAEYGTSSFRTVNETLFGFGGGGGSGVKRSEEITDKAAIGFPYLRLKFNAAAKVDFAIVCSASYSELNILAGDIDVTDIEKWAGTALTGRDISADFANLDIKSVVNLGVEDLTVDKDLHLSSGRELSVNNLTFSSKDYRLDGELVVKGVISGPGVLKGQGVIYSWESDRNK